MITRKQKLAVAWRRVRTEPGLGKNVGVIIGLIVIASIAGSIILSNQRYTLPWADKLVIKAAFEATPGVSVGQGQEVRVSGVPVGEIIAADVDDAGDAVLTLRLEPGTKIYDNATFVMRPKSPLNEMYVTVAPGGPPGLLVEDGQTVPVTNSRRPIQVDEVLAALDDKARSGVTALLSEADDALATAPTSLPAGLDGVTTVSQNLAPVAAELDTRRENLRTLVTSVAQISAAVGENDGRLVELAAALQASLDGIANQSGALDTALGELPELTVELKDSTKAVLELSEELDPTLRDIVAASDELPEALDETIQVTEELDDVVKAARPFIRAARPVIADLRPFAHDLKYAIDDLEVTLGRFDPITATVEKYLPELGAFTVQTRDFISMRDGNGGILRGLFAQGPTTLHGVPGNNTFTQQTGVGPLGVPYIDRGDDEPGDVDIDREALTETNPQLGPPAALEPPN